MRAKLLGQFFLRRSTDDSGGAATWTLSRTNRLRLKGANQLSSFYNNVPLVIMIPRMQIKSLEAFNQFKKMHKLQTQSSSRDQFNSQTQNWHLLSCVSKHAIIILHYSFYTIKSQWYWDKNKHKTPIRICFDCSHFQYCLPKFPVWYLFIRCVLSSKTFDHLSSTCCKKMDIKILRLLWWTAALVKAFWRQQD